MVLLLGLFGCVEECDVFDWGCSSVVERSLCMREAPGSIPGTSITLPSDQSPRPIGSPLAYETFCLRLLLLSTQTLITIFYYTYTTNICSINTRIHTHTHTRTDEAICDHVSWSCVCIHMTVIRVILMCAVCVLCVSGERSE